MHPSLPVQEKRIELMVQAANSSKDRIKQENDKTSIIHIVYDLANELIEAAKTIKLLQEENDKIYEKYWRTPIPVQSKDIFNADLIHYNEL